MITKLSDLPEKIEVQRAFAVLVLISAPVLGSIAQDVNPTPPQGDEDVVKISTTLIQLDVTVTDKGGRPRSDLRRDELEVYENGERQDITNFSFISSVRPRETGAEKERKSSDTIMAPAPVRTLRPEQIRRTIALVVDDLGLSFGARTRCGGR